MDDLIRPNGFGPFHRQGVEIVRRVFVTVRDREWREISPTYWNCTVNEPLQTTVVEARHVSELVDFTWAGTLEVSTDSRSVRFAFEGEVQRTMEMCRLGLIVLHAVETMVGARITALGPQGRETLVVAPTIAPQPMVEGMPAAMLQPFSSLTIERVDIGSIELHFSGDLFEIEDQRNWGDASFKTYCTPLKGFPREIPKGLTSRTASNSVFRRQTRL
jgi:D-apionolactonase